MRDNGMLFSSCWALAVLVCGLCIVSCKLDQSPRIEYFSLNLGPSGEPNLSASPSGNVILSWISYEDENYHLKYCKWRDGSWNQPSTIAKGKDWFVNWADFPSVTMASEADGHLAAHWLEMSADGTYDYDIRVSQSGDNGANWKEPFTLHDDGVSAEHGFVSMLPLGQGEVMAVWLDGRYTKVAESKETDVHDHHGGGPMTLRSAVFDVNGQLARESELDDRVCDCCQTSIAMTDKGPIVAYRDRSTREIRDISVVRNIGGKWMQPRTVFPDDWLMPGCPVNGPSIAAADSIVGVAWFTMRDTLAETKLAFSTNSGLTFDQPFVISQDSTLGRVDLEMIDDQMAVMTWMERKGSVALFKGLKVWMEGPIGDPFTIATMQSSRRSGFPVIAKGENGLIAAWTAIDSGETYVEVAHINL